MLNWRLAFQANLQEVSNATVLSDMISDAMEAKGLSIKDLSMRLDITYEHVRRIVRGQGIPSKPLLRLMCHELNLNFSEAEQLSASDQIKKKFGGLPGKDPTLEPVERLWHGLTEDQQADAVQLMQTWSRRNKPGGNK